MCVPFPPFYGHSSYNTQLSNQAHHAYATQLNQLNFFNNYLAHAALSRPWSRPRSPNQPLKCPLCLVSLEGSDITSHFVEEVKQLEALRSQIREWESKENSLTGVDIKKELNEPEDGFKRSRLHSDKIPPCTRWQTYQRVKQNRHTRISGILRTKRYDEQIKMEDSTTTSSSSSTITSATTFKPVNRGIWTIVDDIKDDRNKKMIRSMNHHHHHSINDNQDNLETVTISDDNSLPSTKDCENGSIDEFENQNGTNCDNRRI